MAPQLIFVDSPKLHTQMGQHPGQELLIQMGCYLGLHLPMQTGYCLDSQRPCYDAVYPA